MKLAVLALVAACGFEHGSLNAGIDALGGGGIIDGQGGGGFDSMPGDGAPACAWSYTPTNFDPCALPTPMSLAITSNMTIDTAQSTLPKLPLTQTDGTPLMVIHLSQFSIDYGHTLTVTGSAVVFAVEGQANIGGTIAVAAGANDPTQCAGVKGENGTDSTNQNGGGGGGGGAAAAADGGNGGNGAGTQPGTRGLKGTGVVSTLSPLRGGCPGGNGGRYNAGGTSPAGGSGGGAFQVSSNAKIIVSTGGFVDVSGRGGAGAPSAHIGAAGGGSGGAIFLEAPTVQLDFLSKMCADGGSGGEGGGTSVAGNDGQNGKCSGYDYARTSSTTNTNGGSGGSGSFYAKPTGSAPTSGAQTDGGGGGGGAGVGWIRVRAATLNNSGSIITPTASN